MAVGAGVAHRRVPPLWLTSLSTWACLVQADVTRSTKVTYARLDKLEAAVVRLSTLAGTQAHVGIGDGESVRSLRR